MSSLPCVVMLMPVAVAAAPEPTTTKPADPLFIVRIVVPPLSAMLLPEPSDATASALAPVVVSEPPANVIAPPLKAERATPGFPVSVSTSPARRHRDADIRMFDPAPKLLTAIEPLPGNHHRTAGDADKGAGVRLHPERVQPCRRDGKVRNVDLGCDRAFFARARSCRKQTDATRAGRRCCPNQGRASQAENSKHSG